MPWKSHETGTLSINIGYKYTMGYDFIPQKDGYITRLGGFYNGVKTVFLWNRTTGDLLAQAEVSSNNNWDFVRIDPVPVKAGEIYTVAVWLAGSGASRRYISLSIDQFPKTFGDIQILGTAFAYSPLKPLRPINRVTNYMYGQVDIAFTEKLEDEELGPELVSDPEFTTPTEWMAEGGWQVDDSERAIFTGDGEGILKQHIALKPDTYYRVEFFADSISSYLGEGAIYPVLGGTLGTVHKEASFKSIVEFIKTKEILNPDDKAFLLNADGAAEKGDILEAIINYVSVREYLPNVVTRTVKRISDQEIKITLTLKPEYRRLVSYGIKEIPLAGWNITNVNNGGIVRGGRIEWLAHRLSSLSPDKKEISYTLRKSTTAGATFHGEWLSLNPSLTNWIGGEAAYE